MAREHVTRERLSLLLDGPFLESMELTEQCAFSASQLLENVCLDGTQGQDYEDREGRNDNEVLFCSFMGALP